MKNYADNIINCLKRKYCIWGTGANCQKLLKKIGQFSGLFEKISDMDFLKNIDYFVDENNLKHDCEFEGKKIKSFGYYLENPCFCIITPLYCQSIESELKNNGFVYGEDYCYWYEVEAIIKNYIYSQYSDIYKGMEISDLYKELQLCKESVEKNIIFSLIWENTIEKKVLFLNTIKTYGKSFMVSALRWIYGNDIDKVPNLIDCVNNREIKKIGLFVYKLYNGGTEKVISLLVPKLIAQGYKVVILSDELENPYDFDLNEPVEHYVFRNRMGDTQDRYRELEEVVEHYGLDLLCYHAGYERIELYYELLLLKIKSIRSIVVLHNAAFQLITDYRPISKMFKYIYKNADKIVTLSSVDMKFWKLLGCDSVYISNPIDVSIKIDHINNRDKINKITWIGRMVNVKNVLDILEIAKEIKKKKTDFIIYVVGAFEDSILKKQFEEKMYSYNVEKNIQLCGFQKNIKKVYEETDIVLMTSSSECFPNVVAESKMCAKPLVMYELPWVELLKNKMGYISVKQRDCEGAAEALIQLMNDRDYYARLSNEAYESIEPFINIDVGAAWNNVILSLDNTVKEDVDEDISYIGNRLVDMVLGETENAKI